MAIRDATQRITERRNPRSAKLDTLPTLEILRIINREDRKVAGAVARVLPEIARAVDLAVEALSHGGRLVYLGAGTSGRLGVLDAAECLPTFGAEQVIAVLAGGVNSMFRSSEASEDDPEQSVRDLRHIRFKQRDILVGITASGSTPYVLGGLRYARNLRAKTVVVTANPNATASHLTHVTIAPVVGPEVIAGSTRMKAGTAQKLVLNMISTATMAHVGRVYSNLMVHIQLTNSKLLKRAEGIIAEITGASETEARDAIEASGRKLPVALLMLSRGIDRRQAEQLLRKERLASLLRQAPHYAQEAMR